MRRPPSTTKVFRLSFVFSFLILIVSWLWALEITSMPHARQFALPGDFLLLAQTGGQTNGENVYGDVYRHLFWVGEFFKKWKEFSFVVETKVHRNCRLLLLLFPKIFRNGFLMTGRLLFSCSFASPKCTWLEKKEKDFLSSFNARKGGVNTSSPLRLKFKFNTTRKRSWTRVVGSIFFYFHDGEQRADNLTVYRYHQQPIFMQLAICICKWKQRWLRWIRQTCIPDENRFVFTFFCLFLPIEKRKNVQSELFLW